MHLRRLRRFNENSSNHSDLPEAGARRLGAATALSLQHAATSLASIPWCNVSLCPARAIMHMHCVAAAAGRLVCCPDLVEAAGGLAWAVDECSQCLVCQGGNMGTAMQCNQAWRPGLHFVFCAWSAARASLRNHQRREVPCTLQAVMTGPEGAGSVAVGEHFESHTDVPSLIDTFNWLAAAVRRCTRYSPQRMA